MADSNPLTPAAQNGTTSAGGSADVCILVEYQGGKKEWVNISGDCGEVADHTHDVSEVSNLALVAKTGDYADLLNRPLVPTKTSELTNDANFASVSDIQVASVTGGTDIQVDNDGSGHLTISAYHPTASTTTEGVVRLATSGDVSSKTAGAAITSDMLLDVAAAKSHSHVSSDVAGLSAVATSGDYADLLNRPQSLTDLTNDAGFITSAPVQALVAGSDIAISDDGAGTYTIASTGTSSGTPGTVTSVSGTAPISVQDGTTTATISIADATTSTKGVMKFANPTEIANGAAGVSVAAADLKTAIDTHKHAATDLTGLSTVATSGDYGDLANAPTIPAAQVPADWNETTSVARILNKPTFAPVATSGKYSDLTGTPPAVVNATTAVRGIVRLADAADIVAGTATRVVDAAQLRAVTITADAASPKGHTHKIAEITDAAAVAKTNSYNDLANLPKIPVKVSEVFNDVGYITEAQAKASADVRDIKAGAGISVSSNTANEFTVTATKLGTVTSVGVQPPLSVQNADSTPMIDIADASTSSKGVVQLATSADVTSRDTSKVVTADLLHDAAIATGAMTYMGSANMTAVAPTAQQGHVYVNSTQGVPDASWAGITASIVEVGECYIYDGASWAKLTDAGGVDVIDVTAPLTKSGPQNNPTLGISQATDATYGTVRLASSLAVSLGTAGMVVDAAQLKQVRDDVVAGAYTLPKASGTVLGGVKIGNGISIDADGVISAASLLWEESAGKLQPTTTSGAIAATSADFTAKVTSAQTVSNDHDSTLTTLGFTKSTYVDVSGDTMTGALTLPAGTAANPALSFAGDAGVFRPAANILGFSTAGTERFRISTTGLQLLNNFQTHTGAVYGFFSQISDSASNTDTYQFLAAGNAKSQFNGPLLVTGGSGGRPAIANRSNPNFGIDYRPDAVAVTTGGVERLLINSSGQITAHNSYIPSAPHDLATKEYVDNLPTARAAGIRTHVITAADYAALPVKDPTALYIVKG